MINITLKQLRYFEAVASFGHFGHAAGACAISQPAISLQIKELEDTLGQTLFERGPRTVRLTEFGKDFAGRAREILRAVEDLGDMARAAQTGFAGTLRFGVIPTIAPYLLPRIIGHMGASYPDLDLTIKETQTDRLLSDLADGQLDLALLALPVSVPTLTETVLFDEEFVLVRGADDAGKPVPNAATLGKMRLLLLEEGHCFRDQALSFCGLRSTLPNEAMEGSSLSTLVQMVASGIGVTLIPAMAVDVETRSANVALARFDTPKPSRKIGLVWRKSTPLADQLYQIADVIKGAAGAV